jgi:hypothetical protein
MKVKPGVRPDGVRPETLYAIMVADSLFRARGGECTVTSLCEGKHSQNSLHYVGRAVDLRIRDVASKDTVIPAIVRDLKEALGAAYDVILEPTHIHIEFDPKGPIPR